MIEKVLGVVINDRDYSESSKILDIFTKEHGLISVLAKGVRRVKSNLRGVSSKLTYGYFHIYYKEDKLSTLIEVDVINNLTAIKKDLLKMSYAIFLSELVGQVIKQTTKNIHDEEIYNDFVAALLKINEGFDPLIITDILELKMLNYLGVCPVLDECVICGDVKSIITISADKGGFLCSKCHTNEYIVSDKTIKFMRMLFYVDISKISKLSIDDKIKKEIDEFINDYYDMHTGLYLKTKTFLNSLKNGVSN
jgi:DNA repair protein RecO (recombination protein O)